MPIELYRAKPSWSIMEEIVKQGDMQLVRHGGAIVAIIKRHWGKDYLSSVRGRLEWVPLYQVGSTVPLAEIHTGTHRRTPVRGPGTTALRSAGGGTAPS